MKVRVRSCVLPFLALFLILGISSQAQADMFAYFVYPQSLTISYNTSENSAGGTSIVMQDFKVGGNTYTGAIFSFGFVNGEGQLLVTQGANVIYSGDISNAKIIPMYGGSGGALRYYQIAGDVDPSAFLNPSLWFDFGQINLTFLPNGNFTGGYFQTFGEGSKTPIPGAVWLLGTGLFGLIAIRRRKKL